MLWSVGTLGALVVWMRTKGGLGAFTLMVASFLPFLVLHGREARMYSLTAFLGVAVACLAERWLEHPSRRLALGISSGALLAGLTHSAALVPLHVSWSSPGSAGTGMPGCCARLLVGAAAIWAVAWGPAFLDQLDGTAAGWIPLTSVSWAETVAAALVSPHRAFLHVSAGLLVVGGALVVLRRRRIATSHSRRSGCPSPS